MSSQLLLKVKEAHCRDPAYGCFTVPLELGDYRHWLGVIQGPARTPYEDGLFALDIQFPPDYPCKPPKITFLTPIYHPNISSSGEISLSILQSDWTPALAHIDRVLLSLQGLLDQPDPESALVPAVAEELIRDKDLFEQMAREWTRKYAM